MRPARMAALAAPLLLAACAVGPDHRRPAMALAPYRETAVAIAPADDRWWMRFGDPLLDRLVAQALAQNCDIAAAAARIGQAQGAAAAAGAALLPAIDLAGAAERDRQSLRTPFGAAAHQLGFPRDYALYQLGGQASWEVDLFGGLRRGREAARADLAAASAAAAGVRLSVAAETADAYLALRGLQARLQVAESQLETERRLVALIRLQNGQGLVADRALNRTLGEEQGIAARLPALRAAIHGQIDRIDVLTGRQAGTGTALLLPAAAVPAAPDPGGGVEPAALMRRRPDLVAAERRLAAADARIGVAIAEYYPHVSLGGLFGTAAVGGAELFGGAAWQATGTGALRWRLFDFGLVDAEVAQARGRAAESLARYRGAVLRATEDVETALTRLAEARTEIALREREVAALTRSRDQARIGYAGGVLALVDVLDADRALLDAADRRAAARAGAARAAVAAARALGGGWQDRSWTEP